MTRTIPAFTLLVLLSLPAAVQAQVHANFRVVSLDGGCWVDDQDPWPTGDPERYFRMAVFDANSTSIFNLCMSGCVDDSNPITQDGRTLDYCSPNTGCGTWNFTDQTIVKVIPDKSGAYFYFGLLDEDSDEDDSLGDHWMFVSSSQGGTPNNNNLSPYYPDYPISIVCGGRDVEGMGDSDNFSVTYSIWFTDSSAPNAPQSLTHNDETAPPGTDDDDRLDFSWAPGSDPNSGIDAQLVGLRDLTDGGWVLYNHPASGTSLTICASGCQADAEIVPGHRYLFRVGSRNGEYPAIINQATSWSSDLEVEVASATGIGDGTTIESLALSAHPNPFHRSTTVTYSLPGQGTARISLFDIRGRRVRDLPVRAETEGQHQLLWDGRDQNGRRVSPGVYFLRLESRGSARTTKLILVD